MCVVTGNGIVIELVHIMRIPGLFIFIFLFFYGCTPDKVTVQIVRHPSIKFDYNTTASWKHDNYSFAPISKVVGYPNDTLRRAVLYNRLTLQSTGHDNTGNNFQLVISFDAVDATQLIGAYTSVYSAQRGLAQVQLFNVTNSSNLSAYGFCRSNIINAAFQIQRQNITEQLISGVFQMTLCNLRDSTQTINITNGTFTDIHY